MLYTQLNKMHTTQHHSYPAQRPFISHHFLKLSCLFLVHLIPTFLSAYFSLFSSAGAFPGSREPVQEFMERNQGLNLDPPSSLLATKI